jgi:hypothetical protein
MAPGAVCGPYVVGGYRSLRSECALSPLMAEFQPRSGCGLFGPVPP